MILLRLLQLGLISLIAYELYSGRTWYAYRENIESIRMVPQPVDRYEWPFFYWFSMG